MRRRDTIRPSGCAAIVVPYVKDGLADETRAWALAHDAELVLLDSRDEAYHEALCEWWAQPGDLMIVEQDIVPADGVPEAMLECLAGWCTSEYDVAPGLTWGWGLGCVKFSEAMRRRHPDAAERAGKPGPHDPEPARSWWTMDVRLGCALAAAGVLPHGHGRSQHLRSSAYAVPATA